MKLLLIVMLSVGFWGCSSAPKESRSTENGNSNKRSEQVSEPGEFGDPLGDQAIEAGGAKGGESSEASQDHLRQALKAQDHRKVEQIASYMLSKNSKDVSALNALGVVQARNNKPEMARLIFKKALEIEPKNASLLNNYALTFYAGKDESRVAQELKKALLADSSNVAAAANWGAIHLKYRNYQEAKRWLENPYSRNKENVAVANNFGLALRGVGDHTAARRVFEGALDKDSKNINLLVNYASLLIENLNDRTKGQEVLNKIKFFATDPAIMERVKQLEAKAK